MSAGAASGAECACAASATHSALRSREAQALGQQPGRCRLRRVHASADRGVPAAAGGCALDSSGGGHSRRPLKPALLCTLTRCIPPGIFIADALSMPVHWFYNPSDIT